MLHRRYRPRALQMKVAPMEHGARSVEPVPAEFPGFGRLDPIRASAWTRVAAQSVGPGEVEWHLSGPALGGICREKLPVGNGSAQVVVARALCRSTGRRGPRNHGRGGVPEKLIDVYR